jgi:flagellin
VETAAGASRAMIRVLVAISIIDAKGTDLGAVQNPVQSTIRNLRNMLANLSVARRPITGRNFAF